MIKTVFLLDYDRKLACISMISPLDLLVDPSFLIFFQVYTPSFDRFFQNWIKTGYRLEKRSKLIGLLVGLRGKSSKCKQVFDRNRVITRKNSFDRFWWSKFPIFREYPIWKIRNRGQKFIFFQCIPGYRRCFHLINYGKLISLNGETNAGLIVCPIVALCNSLPPDFR